MTAASRLRWTTDVHLDHLRVPAVLAFADDLFAGLTSSDMVVITGDISCADLLTNHLRMLDEAAHRACPDTGGVPWAFVLGNHDYYGGRIADVRTDVRVFCMGRGRAVWLGDGPYHVWSCTDSPLTALVGVDGWADARAGNPNTPVLMSDFRLIEDLADEMSPGAVLNWRRGGDRSMLHTKLRGLADAEADMLRLQIHGALAPAPTSSRPAERVIVATHVPPWTSAAWHEGSLSSRDWRTYFVSVAVGRVIEEAARARPDVKFAVLCGHTHGEGVATLLPNLRCSTGAAEYGAPQVQATFNLDAPGAGGLFA